LNSSSRYPDLARIPAIQTGCELADYPATDVDYHELAHPWDFREMAR